MSGSLGIVMLTALMAATEPNITPSELQKNCEKLAAEKFNRETANDEDRFDYRGHYTVRLKSASIRRRWPFLLRPSRQAMPLNKRVERTCEAVPGGLRCDLDRSVLTTGDNCAFREPSHDGSGLVRRLVRARNDPGRSASACGSSTSMTPNCSLAWG
jgi:hypothetical protein